MLAAVALAIVVLTQQTRGGSTAGHIAPVSKMPASDRRAAAHGVRPIRPQPADPSRPVELVLRHTSYVQLAGHRRRDVALTFDDGPSRYTPAILNVLRRMHAPATFFVIGRWARAYPQLVAAEVRAGCEVGDHTETHPPLAALARTAQVAQIAQAAEAIRHAGAPYPVLVRPPYGSFDETTLRVLRAERMLMVLWSADTRDYTRPGVRNIIYAAVSGGQPGAIILAHDGGGDRSETVAALPRIITRLRQRGFRLVTISQLIADDPPPPDQRPPHPLSGQV